MPVKPGNRSRYPSNWPLVRAEAMQRAGGCCQHQGCTARHYAVGRWQRGAAGIFTWDEHSAPSETYAAARTLAAEWDFALGEEGAKPIVIVLTCAHLDHQPENCDPGNLRMFCQRHHLAYDQDHHRATAYATRRAKNPTPDLFAI